jgi:hypothetical protein
MPDALAIPVNLPDAMERYLSRLPGFVHDLEHPTFALRESYLHEGNPVDRAHAAVEIAESGRA